MDIKKIATLGLALALATSLAACGSGSSASTATDAGSSTEATATDTTASSDSGFDAVDFYYADGSFWRGSVETTEATAYGTAGGTEAMEDIAFLEDGTCTLTPCSGHEDLLTGEGTWEGDASSVTVTIDGAEIVFTAVDDNTLSANAADFGIEGFDVVTFVLY